MTNDRPLRRALALTTAGVLAAGSLAACQFIDTSGSTGLPQIALSLDDNSSVRIDIRVCGHDRVSSLSLYEDSSWATASVEGKWWRVDNPEAASYNEDPEPYWFTATLLETPPGWELTSDSLTETREDERYSAHAWTGGFSAEFTLGRFARYGR